MSTEISYKLTSPIRKQIFNYKETVQNLSADHIPSINECNCTSSEFCDPHHGHIISADLRLVQNNELRKILSKGPNFRETRDMDFLACEKELVTGIKGLAAHMAEKSKVPVASLTP